MHQWRRGRHACLCLYTHSFVSPYLWAIASVTELELSEESLPIFHIFHNNWFFYKPCFESFCHYFIGVAFATTWLPCLILCPLSVLDLLIIVLCTLGNIRSTCESSFFAQGQSTKEGSVIWAFPMWRDVHASHRRCIGFLLAHYSRSGCTGRNTSFCFGHCLWRPQKEHNK